MLTRQRQLQHMVTLQHAWLGLHGRAVLIGKVGDREKALLNEVSQQRRAAVLRGTWKRRVVECKRWYWPNIDVRANVV